VLLAIGEGGFPLDPHLARLWYSRAAERGHADAQFNYGLMLILGEGGPVDQDNGLEWIRRAAAQDDHAALRYLSLQA
jgi:TPR repeat protein